MPDFKVVGNAEAPEDGGAAPGETPVEVCLSKHLYDVTAGGWGEEWGQQNSQTLTFRTTHNNSNLFQTAPYVRYKQGDDSADICFTPAPDKVGVAMVELFLSDDGGTANGGKNERQPSPLTFLLTVYERNDPPSFTPGPLEVVADEDGPPYNAPWAKNMIPGPASEVSSRQELDRFDVTLLDPSHLVLFSEQPRIDVQNGFLRFTTAPDANTFNDKVFIKIMLWDKPLLSRCRQCVALPSLEPHPEVRIIINPVNDPPTYTAGGDITILEDSEFTPVQWATAVCVGKAYPNCVTKEGDPSGEGQVVVFDITVDRTDVVYDVKLATDGVLSFNVKKHKTGDTLVTVRQRDTGPPPNVNNATTTFRIRVLQVNDPPLFDQSKAPTILHVKEDQGPFRHQSFLEELRAGPHPNEENQKLSFVMRVEHPELFSEQPLLSPEWHLNARLHGDLTFTTAPNRFGDSGVGFTLCDTGGVSDGGSNCTKGRDFDIMVEPVNDPPSFAVPPPGLVLLWEDGGNEGPDHHIVQHYLANVTAGPFEDGIQKVLFTAWWDPDPFLSPGLRISPAGSVTFAVMSDWHGEVRVTVTGRDWDLTTGLALPDFFVTPPQSFALRIQGVNDPPTFRIADNLVLLPPCPAGAPPCRHTRPGWLSDLSPGPWEDGEQAISAVRAFVASSEKGGSLSAVELDAITGDLSITVTPGRPEGLAEGHVVTLVVTDNGGTRTADDFDTARRNFTVVVSADAAEYTPPPAAHASRLIVAVQPAAESGGRIRAPVFQYVGADGRPAAVSASNISLRLLVLGGSGELVGYTPHSQGPRANITWYGLTVTRPGTYRLEATAMFADGAVLRNATEAFTVAPAATLAAAGWRSPAGSSAPLPSEHDIRLGLSAELSLTAPGQNAEWAASGDYGLIGEVWAENAPQEEDDVPPSSIPTRTLRLSRVVPNVTDRSMLTAVFRPEPDFDIGRDALLRISIDPAAVSLPPAPAPAGRRPEPAQGTQAPSVAPLVVSAASYPLLAAPLVELLPQEGSPPQMEVGVLRSNASVQALRLRLSAPSAEAPCCSRCQHGQAACCRACWATAPPAGGFRGAVLGALGAEGGLHPSGFAARKGALLRAVAYRETVLELRVGGDPGYDPPASERWRVVNATVLGAVTARGVAPEAAVNVSLLIIHPDARRALSLAPGEVRVDSLRAATFAVLIPMAIALLLLPLQAVSLAGELGAVAALMENACQPRSAAQGGAAEWALRPLQAASRTVDALGLLGLLAGVAALHGIVAAVAVARGAGGGRAPAVAGDTPRRVALGLARWPSMSLCAAALLLPSAAWCAVQGLQRDARGGAVAALLCAALALAAVAAGCVLAHRERRSSPGLEFAAIPRRYPECLYPGMKYSPEAASWLQRWRACAAPHSAKRSWLGAAELPRCVAVAAVAAVEPASVGGCQGQLWGVAGLLAARLALLFLLRPTAFASVSAGLRAGTSAAQLVAVLCLAGPLAAVPGGASVTEASQHSCAPDDSGCTWGAAKAAPYLLLLSALLLCADSIYSLWAWWWAHSQPEAGPPPAAPKELRRMPFVWQADPELLPPELRTSAGRSAGTLRSQDGWGAGSYSGSACTVPAGPTSPPSPTQRDNPLVQLFPPPPQPRSAAS
eukprot:TRINITY_DN29864_c0_g1_i1.p1 TRINITY_DN29864_c0_g1~~TRINITY_DN29864_c0_g1_i1.p1  ORF type:complete len:1633 (+),score=433.91 TRINITY_DN29864_c0_g1_i1:969-5867(+)